MQCTLIGMLSYAIHKHSSRSQLVSVLTTCTFMFRQVCIIEPSFFNAASGMYRRPFKGRHLVKDLFLLCIDTIERRLWATIITDSKLFFPYIYIYIFYIYFCPCEFLFVGTPFDIRAFFLNFIFICLTTPINSFEYVYNTYEIMIIIKMINKITSREVVICSCMFYIFSEMSPTLIDSCAEVQCECTALISLYPFIFY